MYVLGEQTDKFAKYSFDLFCTSFASYVLAVDSSKQELPGMFSACLKYKL
ncbi:hypothetical protein ACRALDRAFT_210459 [Sodiomyces alcalophilus JCM 7366]